MPRIVRATNVPLICLIIGGGITGYLAVPTYSGTLLLCDYLLMLIAIMAYIARAVLLRRRHSVEQKQTAKLACEIREKVRSLTGSGYTRLYPPALNSQIANLRICIIGGDVVIYVLSQKELRKQRIPRMLKIGRDGTLTRGGGSRAWRKGWLGPQLEDLSAALRNYDPRGELQRVRRNEDHKPSPRREAR